MSVADEPTLGELGRTIDRLRLDIRDDLAGLSGRLDRLVPLDVYAADHRATEQRMAVVERKADALAQKLDQEVEKLHQRTEQRGQKILAIVAAVAAIIAILVQVYGVTKGASP